MSAAVIAALFIIVAASAVSAVTAAALVSAGTCGGDDDLSSFMPVAAKARDDDLRVTAGGLAAVRFNWEPVAPHGLRRLSVDVRVRHLQTSVPTAARAFMTAPPVTRSSDQNGTAVTIAPTYFWSHQFAITGSENQCHGGTQPCNGYIGLQSNGVLNGSEHRHRLVVFSIWNAYGAAPMTDDDDEYNDDIDVTDTAAPVPTCGTFGHEGVGYSCRRAVPWKVDGVYRLVVERVWLAERRRRRHRLRVPPYHTAYHGTVVDVSSSQTWSLGVIFAHGNWTAVGGPGSLVFSEYYTGTASCATVPGMKVSVSRPRGVPAPSIRSGKHAAWQARHDSREEGQEGEEVAPSTMTAAPYGRCLPRPSAGCRRRAHDGQCTCYMAMPDED